MIAEIKKPIPIIKEIISKKLFPYWILLIAVPNKIITGKASGKVVRIPNIAPLLIDNALPNANKLNNKRFERLSDINTLIKFPIATPLAKENIAPIKAIGTPMKQTYTNILDNTTL